MQQASILVFSSLFILTLFGTIPYLYVSPFDNESPVEAFANGFFSSAAGFTTGGISIFDKPEELPQSFTFYRSFTQLVGGMSFIYLVITAFYPESKLQSMRGFISGRTLHMRELFGTITVIFTLYIVIVAVLLYVFGELDILDNLSLAMSTLATGGFVPSSTILEGMVWQEHLDFDGSNDTWCTTIYIPLWFCKKTIPLTKTWTRSHCVFLESWQLQYFVIHWQ